MKVFSVRGYSGSGKTTTIEKVIGELRMRGNRVGSVKEIHAEGFALDPDPASNTRRHRMAGAELVTARGMHETDILYPEKLPMQKILSFYEGYDWVVLEGVSEIPVPLILTGHNTEDMDKRWSDYVICVSGRIADEIKEYRGVPAISAADDVKPLVDFLEKTVYDLLPGLKPECCSYCGYTCQTLGAEILRGNAKREDCVAERGIELTVDGVRVPAVPFVQKILRNTVLSVVGELDGYREGAEIRIKL